MERTITSRSKQAGFALIASVFLIVVMGLAAVFMVRFSGTIATEQSQMIVAQRAKQAATAGIEYGIYQVANGTCDPSTVVSIPAYSQLSITVDCTKNNFFGDDNLFAVSANASYGTLGDPDYVWRRFQVTLEY